MTRVAIHIDTHQARAMTQYGCCVHVLPADDNVPVGHPITVVKDGMETQAIVFGRQVQGPHHAYVLVDANKLTTRTSLD